MLQTSFNIVSENQLPPQDVLALNARAFGPGQAVRTAALMREGCSSLKNLGLGAMQNGKLVGSIQFWPLRIGAQAALLLGPLTVSPDHQNQGIGRLLMSEGLQRAKRANHELVILVGDEPYYRSSGFTKVPIGQIQLPGPVDYNRLLYCELTQGALSNASGLATPVRD